MRSFSIMATDRALPKYPAREDFRDNPEAEVRDPA
jgi:hypothetical protein